MQESAKQAGGDVIEEAPRGTAPMSPASNAGTVGSNPSGVTVFIEQGVLKSEQAKPCPRCGSWEDPSCACQKQRKRCALFNELMIPALYAEATLRALENDREGSASLRRAAAWVLAWARSANPPSRGILLAGDNGVGKTFLMAALARNLTLERGIGCRFVDFRHLLLRLKATFDGRGSEYEVFEAMQQPPVLILDDVGSHRDSAWCRDVLKTIVALRYNACAPTFVTTNLSIRATAGSLTAFEKWAGAHCASRLTEMCYWLSVDGPDRRRSHLHRHMQIPPNRCSRNQTPPAPASVDPHV
jgi:DNA replication protein DnaC